MRSLAIVGCGAVLEGVHEEPLRRLIRRRGVIVSALVDPSAETRERASRSFPSAYAGADLDRGLAGADAVLVLSPPHTHAEIVVRAAEGDVDVLCEKPLSDSAADLDEIAAATRRSSRIRVAMIRRQFDTYQILRLHKGELIDETDFTMTYREGAPYSWPVRSSAPFFRGPGEAGVLIDVGSHVVDLFHWLLGGPISVSTYRDNATDALSETDAELTLSLPGGEAVVQLSRAQPLPGGWLIKSKPGQVWIPLGPESFIFSRPAGARSWRRLDVRGASWNPCTSYAQAAYRQLEQFIFDDTPLQATAEDGIAVTRLLLDAYAQRQPIGSGAT